MPAFISDFKLKIHEVEQLTYRSRAIQDLIQPYYTISYIHEGDVETKEGSSIYRAMAGDVMIHKPHVPFSVYSLRGGVHYFFNLELLEGGKKDELASYGFPKVVHLRNTAMYETAFRQLSDAWKRLDAEKHARLHCVSLALQLIRLISESHSASTAAHHNQNRFSFLVKYIEDHMHMKLDRSRLAEVAHLHPVYLNRAFRKQYGMSLMEFLRKLRLHRARELLKDPALTLNHIAEQCGLYDASYFSRLFIKEYGIPPGEYRKQQAKR